MLQWVLDVFHKVSVDKNFADCSGGEESLFEKVLNKNPGLVVCFQVNRLALQTPVAASSALFWWRFHPYYSAGKNGSRRKRIKSEYVIVCAGDTPALNPNTIQEFCHKCIDTKSTIRGRVGNGESKSNGIWTAFTWWQGTPSSNRRRKRRWRENKEVTLCNSGVFCKTTFLFELLNEVKTWQCAKRILFDGLFWNSPQEGSSPYVFITKNFKEFDGINDMIQLKKVRLYF